MQGAGSGSGVGLGRFPRCSERVPDSPFVLLGERIAGSAYDHVAIDNVSAARAATLHLIGLGRDRIAAIGDQPYETGETAQLQSRGFQLAHRARRRKLDRSLMVPTERFHYGNGAEAMEQLLRNPGGAPTLTTVSPDKAAIARLAVELLIARATGSADGRPAEIWAPHQLVVRESTRE